MTYVFVEKFSSVFVFIYCSISWDSTRTTLWRSFYILAMILQRLFFLIIILCNYSITHNSLYLKYTYTKFFNYKKWLVPYTKKLSWIPPWLSGPAQRHGPAVHPFRAHVQKGQYQRTIGPIYSTCWILRRPILKCSNRVLL